MDTTTAPATAAQIDYITSLQADKAWIAGIDHTAGIEAQITDMAQGKAIREMLTKVAAGTELDPVEQDAHEHVVALHQAQVAAEAAGESVRRAGREHKNAAKAVWVAAKVAAMTAHHEAREAALTIDPATLTKSEASAIIDLLK